MQSSRVEGSIVQNLHEIAAELAWFMHNFPSALEITRRFGPVETVGETGNVDLAPPRPMCLASLLEAFHA